MRVNTLAGGKTRTVADDETPKGWDHDPPPKQKWTPLGILVVATGVLSLIFGSRETSDFWVDGLKHWCPRVQVGFGSVRLLIIYLDNGPHNSGSRTQFLKRMVAFADAHRVSVELVYLPPYHSKYNPIERCWGILERHWNGALLGSVSDVLQWAATMTWRGVRPFIRETTAVYERGVRLTKAAFRPIAARLTRSATLPKWSLIIRPKEPGD